MLSQATSPGTHMPADFNGDGHLDIATGNFEDGTVSVLLALPASKADHK